MFLGEAYIIETDDKKIERFGRVEIEGIITHIIHGDNNKVGDEKILSYEITYLPADGIKFIFTRFIEVINFKAY